MNLAEALISPDAILYIGSGVSAWSGLPSWRKMLDELADYLDHHGIGSELVRTEAEHGDLLQAASYGFDKLTRHQQGEFVRSACRYGTAHPSILHRLLVTLGPRCLVTTNYDNLVEEALRLWRPNDFFRPPVTNRNLIGIPEIVQARAVDFVYKPHGDAADSESIILTREQYRSLLPGGDRQSALESLKMLLVSRPVIYVRFGLRDPDFIYLKDVLLNIYSGGTRDHFALIADVSIEQIDYWRRIYGIHVITYATTLQSDGSRDHGALLTLLETASRSMSRIDVVAKKSKSTDPETLLALARYASKLMRFSKPTTEFTIRVASKNTRHPKKWDALDSFFDAKVEVLLDRFDKPTILIGLPGAGKSYSLRKSAADQAEKLHTTCLREKPDAADLVVPIFADLKLYQGNLETLITASLPAGLDFHDLLDKFTVRIYLDSFNEMPRKFVESGECKSDLGRFLQTIGTSPIVIGSRTLDGLEGLRFASYEIDAIEESTVDEELRKRGFSLGGRFQVEMKALLQRPFFFRYILDGEITLPAEPHPKEFYRLILNRAGQKLATKLLRPLDLVKILRPVAYQALNSGEEAFPLTRLLRAIEANAPGSAADGTSASDIANGLVAHSILIPYSGERIAFVHQSITEYLASFELAERFGATPELLREKLSLRRWDQALFLALSHLKPPLDHQFFHAVLNIDLGLAIASAKFVEVGRDQLVSELLDELIRRGDSIDRHDFFQVESAMINSFPVNESHLPKLTQLLRSAHPLRGTAFRYVVGIRGRAVKNEYLRLLVEFRGDYNFCANVVGPTLAQFATDEDLATLAQWSRELEIGLKDGEFEEKEYHGFVFGGAAFAARLSFASVRQYLLPLSREELVASPLRTELIRNIALDLKTTDALKCACDLLLLGDIKVSFIIHLILAHSDSEGHLNVNLLAISHIEALLTIFCNTNSEYNMWAGGAIDDVCKCRPDLRPMVESRAAEMSGIQRAHLLMCVRQDQAPLFVALEALLLVSNDELRAADSTSIYHSNLNWKGKETLLLSLLARKDPRLCRGLIGIGIPVDLKGFGKVEILNSTWWLEWLAECLDVNDHWLVGTLSSFLGKYATKSLTHRMVTAFNDPTSEHRSLILSHVLPFFDSVSTEDLSDEGVLFAIDHLLREEISIFGGTFLGGTATESFVNEKILPLLSRVGEAEVLRVRQALDEAGQRHGRRYF